MKNVMSKIGKKNIIIPKNVFINIINNKIIVSGTYGCLPIKILAGLQIIKRSNNLQIVSFVQKNYSSSFHGLMRAKLINTIFGVMNKFLKTIKISGVGYKFNVNNNIIILNVGKTHIISLVLPELINIENFTPTHLSLSSIDKNKLTLFCAKLKSISPVEPYNGRGIFYENEKLIRKSGKRKIK